MDTTISWKSLSIFWVSFFVSPILVAVAALEASKDPENFIPSKAFFPFGYLVGSIWSYFDNGDSTIFSIVLMILVFIQWPIYGIFVSLARRKLFVAIVLLVVHFFLLALSIATEAF